MYTESDLLSRVLATLESKLPNSMTEWTEVVSLPDLPGFDSLMIAHILETLEEELGIEAEPALLLPEAFETPGSVAKLFMQSQKLHIR